MTIKKNEKWTSYHNKIGEKIMILRIEITYETITLLLLEYLTCTQTHNTYLCICILTSTNVYIHIYMYIFCTHNESIKLKEVELC